MNTSTLQRLPDGIAVEITRKNIRTLRLSVHAPDGRVKVSAPVAMPEEFISAFVLDRLGWIRKHQLRLAVRHDPPACRYADGERHWFCGRRYVLKVIEHHAPARVALGDDSLVLQVRPGANVEQRRALLDAWYRRHLKATLPALIAWHQPRMGVQVQAFGVKQMKTRWGSCNPRARRIWLNLELARAPSECLEYVVVHEMVHLLERRHNPRFHALMDRFLPGWHEHKDRLNSLPLR